MNNGAEVASDTDNGGGPYSTADGRIVVGRYYTEEDGYYASVQVDKLVFFNSSLKTADIEALSIRCNEIFLVRNLLSYFCTFEHSVFIHLLSLAAFLVNLQDFYWSRKCVTRLITEFMTEFDSLSAEWHHGCLATVSITW